MPNASEQTAAPIRARVHDGALRRVTRFFSSTPADIFSELLQNARRAGATCVAVDTVGLPEREGGGIRVTVYRRENAPPLKLAYGQRIEFLARIRKLLRIMDR